MNDPISSSVKKRMAEGSFLSVIKDKKDAFFFPMTLKGSGADIPDGPNKSKT
jgi:hypothetical protein